VVIVPHSIAVSEQKVTCPPNLQIIAVGRLSFQKNPEAFKSLKEKLNTSGVHASWLWVGGGEKRYEDLLTSAGIQVTGWVDPNEVASILERASIMFHPARYEGLPMAVLESMAAGVPVIASDIPAHQSLDSVFVYHDLLSAAAHVQVIANEQKWLKFSLLGQEEIKSKFGFENQKSALTALYSCALKFSINTSRLR
jgi:glycosyltransferase involved in cell wall biosynthesis